MRVSQAFTSLEPDRQVARTARWPPRAAWSRHV